MCVCVRVWVCSVHEHKQEYTALMSPNRAKRPQCRLQFSLCVCVGVCGCGLV